MGMSSSQARLLNLTARMHDIEYKAQRIEAQKLQLANDSRRVYEDYLFALDATKVQYKTLNTDGSVTFRDANCDILQNGCVNTWAGEKSATTLFLQRMDGVMLVTPTVANKYGIDDSESVEDDMNVYIKRVTGKDMKERQVFDHYEYPPNGKIDAVTPAGNEESGTYTAGYVYKDRGAVGNTPGEQAALVTNTFKNSGTSSHAYDERTTVRGLESLTSTDLNNVPVGTTFQISSADDLVALASLYKTRSSSVASKNLKFVLTADIDMSGINWEGIKSFSGTIDGNYHKIMNLGGAPGTSSTASNGLIASTYSAYDTVIQDLYLENVNIKGSSTTLGGIIADTDGNTTISNCVVTGKIEDTASSGHCGGIVGESGGIDKALSIEDCNVNINIVSGALCNGGILGHGDNYPSSGTSPKISITGCNVTGSLSGSGSYMGGIVGHNQSGRTFIDYCQTQATVASTTSSPKLGAVIGCVDDKTKYQIGEHVTYDPHITTANPSGIQPVGNDSSMASMFKAGLSVPKLATGFYSNLYGALHKVSNGEIENLSNATTSIQNYINTLKSSSNGDNLIANLNNYLYNYIQETSGYDSTLISAIYNDIQNGGNSSIAQISALNTYPPNQYSVEYVDAPTWEPEEIATSKKTCTIPSVAEMIKAIEYLYKKQNDIKIADSVDPSIKQGWQDWFDQYDVNNSDNDTAQQERQYLANFNDLICSKNLSQILSIIDSGNKYEGTAKYDLGHYQIEFGSKTASYEEGKDQVEKTRPEPYWDTSDPDIANAMAMWILAKRGGVEVIKDGMESSEDYLVNMLNGGFGVLTTFDPSKITDVSDMTPDDVLALTDQQFNDMLGIENTSIATNTSVQEVSNEVNLRKAEAKYEADMRRIDRKDRKFDTDLAAIDTERNAIKQEMETLKTVARDNVERTFKLFG